MVSTDYGFVEILLASTSSVKPLSRRSISEHVEASCPTSTSWPRNLSRHTDQPCPSSGHHCEKRQRDQIIISLSPMVPIYCSIGARSHSLPISTMVRVWVKGQQTAERHSLAKSVSAVADGPARRAASHASCCTQRWMIRVIN